MSDDLVKWLRSIRSPFAGQAADRIEAQAAEIERLKAEVKNAWCDDALPCRQLMDAK